MVNNPMEQDLNWNYLNSWTFVEHKVTHVCSGVCLSVNELEYINDLVLDCGICNLCTIFKQI